MKIGIVTFHRAHNCGAALQCLALVKVLQRMGHEAKVIDCNDIGEGDLFPDFHKWRAILGWMKRFVFQCGATQRLWFRYRKFMKRNFPLTQKVQTTEKFPKDLDRVILGSDQVLNPELTREYSEVFLLKERCADYKKIAYAASFGVSSLGEAYRETFSESLSRFRAIGIREKSGVRICKDELKLKVVPTITIDPTLLLDSNDYRQFETPVATKGEYVLVYWIGYAKEYVCGLAKRIAKKYGIKVIVATITTDKFEQYWKSTSPDEFLYLVHNAKFVVTTSFHGTAFAIINRKPFITVVPKGLDVSSRLTDMLDQLLLQSQIVSEEENISDSRLNALLNVNFCKSECSLNTIRNESCDFLRNALS